MKKLISVAAALVLISCSPSGQESKKTEAAPETASAQGPVIPVSPDLPAGTYTLDKSHASLHFRVSHIGFSNYTAAFGEFDAELQLDPKAPANATISAKINPKSLTLPAPPKGFVEELLGANWLDAAKFPEITFKSTSVELTGPDTANVAGDLSLHGVTLPVTLAVKFNGGYKGHPMDPNARIGFSAKGTLKRSGFGVSLGVPEPGTTMGVGDDVEVIIEAEFSGPPLSQAAQPPAQ